MDVGFIGAGAAAWTLAPACVKAGHRVVAVTARRAETAAELARHLPDCSPRADAAAVAEASALVFVAVPDDRVAAVAERVAWRPGQMVVHCSGALPAGVLAAAAAAGAATGSLHPLLALVRGRSADLGGVFFALEADEPLRGVLAGIVDAVGGRWAALAPADRPLYHAAAAMAANAAVTMTWAAAAMLRSVSVDAGEGDGARAAAVAAGLGDRLPPNPERETDAGAALAAMLPLLRSTADNLERALGRVARDGGAGTGLPRNGAGDSGGQVPGGPPLRSPEGDPLAAAAGAALTGPVARGDAGVVAAHLRALRARRADLLPLYRELGRASLGLALAAGRLPKAAGERLAALLDGAGGG